MLKVGITGGIGSGKSTVCQVFETLGIPVFYADGAGKYLLENDSAIISSVKALFGDEVYTGGVLDREKIAAIVFKDKTILGKLNNIIHPAVIRYSVQWMEKQRAPYVLKEAAIFFESGSYKEMDVMIGVYAPRKLRILRVMERDSASQEKILERMSYQMSEEEKMKRCNFVITNDDVQAVIPQVLKVHEQLLEMAVNPDKSSR
ncbi:MAG TPA: dephospho-CoA kinase [Flavipsychrobacter sp.]|nr:dephospho-CoA kinase [Flavipsychrobacter sp.]